jgi:hypothetical protein
LDAQVSRRRRDDFPSNWLEEFWHLLIKSSASQDQVEVTANVNGTIDPKARFRRFHHEEFDLCYLGPGTTWNFASYMEIRAFGHKAALVFDSQADETVSWLIPFPPKIEAYVKLKYFDV